MNVMIFRFRKCEEYCYASSDSIWVEKRFCRSINGSNILSSPGEVEEWCVYSKLFSKVEHPNVGWRMGLLMLIVIVAVSWENVSCVSMPRIHRPRTFHAKVHKFLFCFQRGQNEVPWWVVKDERRTVWLIGWSCNKNYLGENEEEHYMSFYYCINTLLLYMLVLL